VLLDGGFGVNIILKSLKKKFGLRKPQLALFVIRMANQQKTQLLGLIRNLKIDFASCVYRNSVTILNVENGIEAYSMFLRRLWLKQVKVCLN
jgi:hypothetical protein